MKQTQYPIYLIALILVLYGCLSDSRATPNLINPTMTQYLQNSTIPPISTQLLATDALSVTPLPKPTVNETDAFLLFDTYLSNSVDCMLPCWGGITPGKSTIADVQNQLSDFNSISVNNDSGYVTSNWYVASYEIHYRKADTVIIVAPGYIGESEKMDILEINVQTYSVPQNKNGRLYGDKDYNTLLKAYTLPEILSTYGIPPFIFTTVAIYPEPDAPDFFDIWLAYLDLGLFVNYEMPNSVIGDNYKFCPNESVVTLDMIPKSATSDYQDYFRQLGIVTWGSIPTASYSKTIQEALGISPEEFSQIIISSPETCFESPINIWPKP